MTWFLSALLSGPPKESSPPSPPAPELGKLVVKGIRHHLKTLPQSREKMAHVAVIAALVMSLFLALVYGSLLLLLVIGAGIWGEGYLVYQIYQKNLAAEKANE